MHVRNKAIAVVTVLLTLAAIAGYVIPANTRDVPVKVLLDNKGGYVVFDHKQHIEEYDLNCISCHHTEEGDNEPLPCGTCHVKEFNEEFVDTHMDDFSDPSTCVKCHHTEFTDLNFDHDEHEEYADQDCQACHHSEDIEPEPTNCSDCHDSEDTPEMPSLKKAAHQRCMDCHDDLFEEDDLSTCSTCHNQADMKTYDGDYTSCSSCHDKKTEELIPTRTNAFHEQCISCHKERDAGPRKPEDCSQCHFK